MKNFGDFERDERIKRENDRIETSVRETNTTFRLLKVVQVFIIDREVVLLRKA